MVTARRNTELGLILLVVVITASAYTLASLGTLAVIPANIIPFLLVILGLLVAAHIAVRKLAPDADPLLLPLAAVLNGIGYVFIARLDEDLAGLQAGWTAAGIVAFVLTLLFVRRVRDLERYRYLIGAGGVFLLLMPLIPGVGSNINGAQIWVSLGPANFQPGEFAKIALAIFFASYLAEKRELLGMATFQVGPFRTPEPKHLGPILLAWGFSLVVMFYEKDLGSSLLFFALFVVLLWVATERVAYLVVSVGLFAIGAYIAFRTFGHVQQRVDIWLNPWTDPDGDGFQVIQSWFALAFGGITGTGPGLGRPDTIPVAESDFIFAAIGEELGLAGGTLILAAYLLFVGSGLRIAAAAEEAFEKLLATGLTFLIGFQAFLIMAGVVRLLPLTGVTLPFVSYGGSSLIANYVLLALLLRISHDSAQRAAERARKQAARAAVGAS
jgi:cell division protein FtsW (lipid II flippase)